MVADPVKAQFWKIKSLGIETRYQHFFIYFCKLFKLKKTEKIFFKIEIRTQAL